VTGGTEEVGLQADNVIKIHNQKNGIINLDKALILIISAESFERVILSHYQLFLFTSPDQAAFYNLLLFYPKPNDELSTTVQRSWSGRTQAEKRILTPSQNRVGGNP